MPQTVIFFNKIAYKPIKPMMQRGFDSDIREVLNPDLPIIRYGRTWRLSRPAEHGRNYLVGKLGFEASESKRQTYYDDKAKDFIEKSVSSRQGHYVQWAIDLSNHIMAFETKIPDIKYQSFKGAFCGLLDKYPDIGLTVEDIMESSKFYEWAKRIDKLTKFSANLRAPNPDFESRPKFILAILQDTNADHAKIELSKDKGSKDSLDINKTIPDLVKYGEDGYSTINARGLLKNGQSKIFDSKQGMPADRIDLPMTAKVEDVFDFIIEALKRFKNEKH